jgi:hypothetical protein
LLTPRRRRRHRRRRRQVENWDVIVGDTARERMLHDSRPSAADAARAMAAELKKPSFVKALDVLKPTAVGYFNATEYEAANAGQERGPCFERVTPKGALHKV